MGASASAQVALQTKGSSSRPSSRKKARKTKKGKFKNKIRYNSVCDMEGWPIQSEVCHDEEDESNAWEPICYWKEDDWTSMETQMGDDYGPDDYMLCAEPAEEDDYAVPEIIKIRHMGVGTNGVGTWCRNKNEAQGNGEHCQGYYDD